MARGTFALCRRHGHLIALWAHPLDMQTRSGRTEPLFTPDPRLKTRGGFGLRGTRCPEFKRLDRGCQSDAPVGWPLRCGSTRPVEADDRGVACAEDMGPATEREGLMSWARYWQFDLDADKEATETLVDAMACYTWHLKSQGASPRAMSAKYADLNALGYLVLAYDTPKGKEVLNHLWPWDYEYSRKFSDTPRNLARYERHR